jgi:hypothetical protein
MLATFDLCDLLNEELLACSFIPGFRGAMFQFTLKLYQWLQKTQTRGDNVLTGSME